MVTIVLLRHGHVSGIAPERFRGRLHLELTELGRRQADAAGARVRREWKPAAVHASPLARAVATAEAIAGPLGLPVLTDAALEDIDYGTWQGQTKDEVREREPDAYRTWLETPQFAQFDGGESLGAVLVRASGFVRRIASLHAGETIAVVGHDSVNRVLLLAALDIPLSHYHRLPLAPCSISVLTLAGRPSSPQLGVVSMNDTGHLTDVR